ncbi:MAG: signal peptidase I [Nitrososphaera sp.]
MLDKDSKSKLPVAIKDILIIGIGVLVVWLVIWVSFGSNPFYVVSSGSMEPTLMVNDVLVVRDGGSWEDLKVGDIIVFNRPEGEDRVIVHRIVDIDIDSDGDRVIRTKGDNNPASIPGTDYPIREDNYIGRVVYVVPGIGVVTKIISPPVNYIIIAIILAILFFNRLGKKDTKGSPATDNSSNNTASSSGGGQPPT